MRLFDPFRQRRRQKRLRSLSPDASQIPLCWAATTKNHPFANLGDALSPIIISALSGLPSVHRNFDSDTPRLASVGSIAHGLKNGVVHFWGSGIDKHKNPVNRELGYYTRPPNTTFHVHAMRGPFSAEVLRNQDMEVPSIYGDPVWFLPAIMEPAAEKQYELGVVVHLSELTGLSLDDTVRHEFIRYWVPKSLARSVRIITTLTPPTLSGLEDKIKEMTACKRIASTSLHGLVIAETYGIPCAYFPVAGEGVDFREIVRDNPTVDARMLDFYGGVGYKKLFVYGRERHIETDWDELIEAIDTHWQPIDWNPQPFLDTFPLPLAFNPLRHKFGQKFGDRDLLERIKL